MTDPFQKHLDIAAVATNNEVVLRAAYDCAKLINKKAISPPLAVHAIQVKLRTDAQATLVVLEIRSTLAVLEKCAKLCGPEFHRCLSTVHFMTDFVHLLYHVDGEIRQKALEASNQFKSLSADARKLLDDALFLRRVMHGDVEITESTATAPNERKRKDNGGGNNEERESGQVKKARIETRPVNPMARMQVSGKPAAASSTLADKEPGANEGRAGMSKERDEADLVKEMTLRVASIQKELEEMRATTASIEARKRKDHGGNDERRDEEVKKARIEMTTPTLIEKMAEKDAVIERQREEMSKMKAELDETARKMAQLEIKYKRSLIMFGRGK